MQNKKETESYKRWRNSSKIYRKKLKLLSRRIKRLITAKVTPTISHKNPQWLRNLNLINQFLLQAVLLTVEITITSRINFSSIKIYLIPRIWMNRTIKISNLWQHLMISLTTNQKRTSKHITIKQIIQHHRNSKHQTKNPNIIMILNMINTRKNMKTALKTMEIMEVLRMTHIHHSRLTLCQKINPIIILPISMPITTTRITQTKVIQII